jgi:hypothetical protein
MAFANACSRFRNYSAAHESRVSQLGPGRFDYPVYHIEVDNRLSWLLGRLHERHGDDVAYLHLRRDPEMVARSYNQRWHNPSGIASAYASGIVLAKELGLDVIRDLIDTVDSNIRLFLSCRPHAMTIDIDEVGGRFPEFVEWVGADCDIADCMSVFEQRHNPSRAFDDEAEIDVAANTTIAVLKNLQEMIMDYRRQAASANSERTRIRDESAALRERVKQLQEQIKEQKLLESESVAKGRNAILDTEEYKLGKRLMGVAKSSLIKASVKLTTQAITPDT